MVSRGNAPEDIRPLRQRRPRQTFRHLPQALRQLQVARRRRHDRLRHVATPFAPAIGTVIPAIAGLRRGRREQDRQRAMIGRLPEQGKGHQRRAPQQTFTQPLRVGGTADGDIGHGPAGMGGNGMDRPSVLARLPVEFEGKDQVGKLALPVGAERGVVMPGLKVVEHQFSRQRGKACDRDDARPPLPAHSSGRSRAVSANGPR